MAREISNAWGEVVSRLKTANVDGGLLAHVKLIEAPVEQTIEQAELPVIVYEILNGGTTEMACFPAGMKCNLTILFTVLVHTENGYFNDERNGIVDYHEKVMTVLDGFPTLDLTGSGNWGSKPPVYRVGTPERDNMQLKYLIEMDIETKKYMAGSLQS